MYQRRNSNTEAIRLWRLKMVGLVHYGFPFIPYPAIHRMVVSQPAYGRGLRVVATGAAGWPSVCVCSRISGCAVAAENFSAVRWGPTFHFARQQ